MVDNSISRRRKRRLDGTTLAANDRLPISDRRSLFVVLKGGELRMKCTNAKQPTACTGVVHHVYIAEMPEPCLVPSPSCFVCVHGAFAIGVQCMCAYIYVCLINICISQSGIINGTARNSPRTHFYSPSLQLCVL